MTDYKLPEEMKLTALDFGGNIYNENVDIANSALEKKFNAWLQKQIVIHGHVFEFVPGKPFTSWREPDSVTKMFDQKKGRVVMVEPLET